jgi:signal transduction histidine kinase
MARLSNTGGKTTKAKSLKARQANGRKTANTKRRTAEAVTRLSVSDLQEQLERRTKELEETLQQQTATADVLKVISRSAFDLQTVLDTLVESAARLCKADSSHIYLREGEVFQLAACSGFSLEYEEFMRQLPLLPGRGSLVGRTVSEGRIVHLPDAVVDPEYTFHQAQRLGRFRTMLGIPMIRDGATMGVLAVTRSKVSPFTNKQIELVQTFADQAVIAIGNVRLFDEVQAKTRDLEESLQFQTASAEVLKVISRSPDTLQPVLDVIVETSRELCDALTSVIFLLRDGKFYCVAESSTKPEYIEALRANPISPDQVGSVLARAAREKRTIHVPNTAEDPEAGFGGPISRAGPRALLSAPLIREGEVIGGITLRQSHLSPFTFRQIEAVETFADQAVIAISNVSLFEQVQQRTRELSQSLDDLRTAQDRLIQTEKLASLGQLTAGIAHEIKNPLNFVNNFSALSVELTDELKGVLKPAVLDQTIRAEVDEITSLLKDNLGKVVQHGRRADSIVKNMLLHSREGSGERRSADINALVGESLNLAYHGARAEKPGFTITLKQDLDPNAGALDLYPQEIIRALLNLISNGFYAATRRKVEADDDTFEPILTAATRNLCKTVEIRIRDNGTGIPPEVKEKMFNPFFTTKPSGEGTGLGLSMTHDIIVKQHGGRIDVETEAGAFTEFIITLPRGNVTAIGEKPE